MVIISFFENNLVVNLMIFKNRNYQNIIKRVEKECDIVKGGLILFIYI